MLPRADESMVVTMGFVSVAGVRGGTGLPVSWTSSIFTNFADRGESSGRASAFRLIICSLSVAIIPSHNGQNEDGRKASVNRFSLCGPCSLPWSGTDQNKGATENQSNTKSKNRAGNLNSFLVLGLVRLLHPLCAGVTMGPVAPYHHEWEVSGARLLIVRPPFEKSSESNFRHRTLNVNSRMNYCKGAVHSLVGKSRLHPAASIQR